MLENHAKPAVEIRDHGELKTWRQLLEHLLHFGIKFPHSRFREMSVGDLKKGVAIERINLRRGVVEDAVHKFAPPAFVVIFARFAGGGTERHFLPDLSKGAIQIFRIKEQSLTLGDESIMLADTFR